MATDDLLAEVRTVGIFGGTFDPPHTAHLILAELAREELELDFLLFVPAFIPPHKRGKGSIVSPDVRLEMIRLAVAANPSFGVSALELEREGISYTVDSLRHFTHRYPQIRFTLLMGSDNARDFRNWREPEEILEMADIGVWERPGNDTSSEIYQGHFARIIGAPLLEISSTEIRERVAAGRSIRYMVPDRVIDYIYENGIYR